MNNTIKQWRRFFSFDRLTKPKLLNLLMLSLLRSITAANQQAGLCCEEIIIVRESIFMKFFVVGFFIAFLFPRRPRLHQGNTERKVPMTYWFTSRYIIYCGFFCNIEKLISQTLFKFLPIRLIFITAGKFCEF